MDKIIDQIDKLIKKSFKDYDLDISKFSQDIICFNRTGEKCAAVYEDNKDINKYLIMVCLLKSSNGTWELAMFERRKRDTHNGIDMINLTDAYLKGYYSVFSSPPEK